MKFTIQPPTERNDYFQLPEREPDEWPREIRSDARPLLGETRVEEPQGESEMNDRDYLADFLSDSEAENPTETTEADASWKHSRWTSVLLISAIAVLAGMWYLASRSDGGLPLARVKIEGASLLTNQEVLQLAAIDYRVPFYKIDLKQIEGRLLTHSLIRSAHVRRELDPATLVLSIEERQPVAILRSDSVNGVPGGETYLIDRDGMLLRPKLIAGLRDPAKLLQVPLLSGVSARDTASFRAMAKMVTMIAALDSGSLASSIGEFHRAPNGAFVLYTSETVTPIFLGSPFDQEFHTALEQQLDAASASAPKNETPLFYRQLQLLAQVWKAGMQNEVRAHHALYIDARFNGQIILKQRFQNGTNTGAKVPVTALQSEPNHPQYATNAIKRSN